MLNQAQKDFLNSMIGQKGYIIETIKENDLCPLSIKILYLTRSIQHPPEIFLKQLDKLYLPDMEVNQIEKHIDFLVHLKTINDLCFNSNIQFIDNFEIASLEYYFAHLGLIVDSKAFKIAIKQAIQERIFELSYQHESDILLQMKLRMDIEDNIPGHKGWRLFAHLTNQQIDEVEQSTLLNPHRHQFFFMEQTQSLSSENSKACKKIDVILSKQLLDHLDSFLILTKHRIKVEDLTALTLAERELLLSRAETLVRYLYITQTTFSQFLSLDYQQKNLTLNQFEEIELLGAELIKIPYPERQQFSDNLDAIFHLIHHSHIDFATIFQASLDMRYHFFVYYHEIHQLLATQCVQIYELINLDEQRRTFVLSESSKIIELMTKLKVRYYVIQQLTFEQLELVTQNIEALIKLHPHIDSSLEPLLKLSPSISKLIYSHIDSFIILLNSEEMDYQQLINLNIEQLELLLLNPEQDNIQLILRPSISCSIL